MTNYYKEKYKHFLCQASLNLFWGLNTICLQNYTHILLATTKWCKIIQISPAITYLLDCSCNSNTPIKHMHWIKP